MQPHQGGLLRRPAPVWRVQYIASPRSWLKSFLASVFSSERIEAAGTHSTCLWRCASMHCCMGAMQALHAKYAQVCSGWHGVRAP